jgi:hypothetical protein
MSIYTQVNITFQQETNMSERTTRSKGPAALSSGLVHSRQKKPKVAQAVPQVTVGTSSSGASADGRTINIAGLSLRLRPSPNVNVNVITTSADAVMDPVTEGQSNLNTMPSNSVNVIPHPTVGDKCMKNLTKELKDSAIDDSDPGSSDDEDDINKDTLDGEDPDVIAGDPFGFFPDDDHFGNTPNGGQGGMGDGGQGGMGDGGQDDDDQIAVDTNDDQGGMGDGGQGGMGDGDLGGMGDRVLPSGSKPGSGQGFVLRCVTG